MTPKDIIQNKNLIAALTEDVFTSDDERYLVFCEILTKYPDINLDAHDLEGKTALHWASSNNDFYPFARDLIRYSANCNIMDQFGNTPLMRAVDNFCLETVGLLLEEGADPKLSGNTKTCYSLALEKNLSHLANIFESIIVKNTEREKYSQPFLKTAKQLYSSMGQNNRQQVENLLAAHPHLVDYRNEAGATPLHWAVKMQNIDLVKCVLHHNPNCTLSSWDGNTALHIACANNLWQIAHSILQHNKNSAKQLTSQQNIDELTPLELCVFSNSRHTSDLSELLKVFEHLAPYCGVDTLSKGLTDTAYGLQDHSDFEQLCLVLLNKGADINALDKEGRTLLHWIANEPKPKSEFIHWLIANGADHTIKDTGGLLAQDIASPENTGIIESYVSKRDLENALDVVEKPTTTRKI